MTQTSEQPKSWRDSLALIDRPTFLGAIALLLAATLPLAFWPAEGAMWVGVARAFMVDKIGAAYLLLGLGAFFFMVFIIFSKIGQIKLGDPDEAPEFPTGSWAAMLFCGGIGASILYWGVIEWAYYYVAPPFGLEPGSRPAIQWAAAYGMFHWGLIAWSIYLIPALPIAYFYYVRKRPALKISIAVMPVIGQRAAEGWPGKVVDILFIFGLLGGAATTLGLAAPLITRGMNILFGTPVSIVTQIAALLICTVIFALSSYAGLGRGLKLLSNINLWLAVGFLAFVLVVGPTVFLLETGLSSLGRMLSNFFTMATYTESFGGWGGFGDSHFPQDWTIFYWAWWLVFAPSMGLFIARISRGRTIGQMVAGSIFFGSVGCFLFFIILGNYGLWLQINDVLDVVSLLDADGPFVAIFAVLDTLPLTWLVVFAFTVLAILFTATSFDSISYILASVVQNDVSEEPMAWNRLFWALALTFLPAVLLIVGGLNTLQTAAIVGGVPLLVITAMLCVSTIRVAQIDLRQQPDYTDPIINIEDIPRIDPWSPEGAALSRFDKRRAEASAAATREKEALDALTTYKHMLRRRYGPFGAYRPNAPQANTEELKRLEELEAAYTEASAHKAKATQAAQEARSEFDRLVASGPVHHRQATSQPAPAPGAGQ
ncbi:BCCT family transporter [Kaustia mangrovi]|uniref:BCCT family transporter n=1 Tax=Kaustia mangrovi TaxID=2593653 RepID=A0A7S8HAH2_9HYPH|nr:BCCT family transporter [Kaustia mangrovi]QPC41429.1 BCCT family transporter [Kaustia mangrovi]